MKNCQQEIIKQLDVRSLINRIIFLEHCLSFTFDDYQLDGIQMKTPKTPEEIKMIREKCECVLEGQELLGSSKGSNHCALENTVNKYELKQSPCALGK